MSAINKPETMTIPQFCKEFGLSQSVYRKAVREARLPPAQKIGFLPYKRYHLAHVQELADKLNRETKE